MSIQKTYAESLAAIRAMGAEPVPEATAEGRTISQRTEAAQNQRRELQAKHDGQQREAYRNVLRDFEHTTEGRLLAMIRKARSGD